MLESGPGRGFRKYAIDEIPAKFLLVNRDVLSFFSLHFSLMFVYLGKEYSRNAGMDKELVQM
jgi:hypothetical protein